jgi:hypothetical protein
VGFNARYHVLSRKRNKCVGDYLLSSAS